MLASILKYSKEVTTAADFKILDAEDVANAVISSLATPPNVLVSKNICRLSTCWLHISP